MGFPRYFGVKGKPARVCGHVYVEWPESEIALLIDVSKAVADLVVVTRGVLSPRASVHGRVAA